MRMLFFAPLSLAACASTTPGAQPHDMSAAGHEVAAQQHEQTAETHAAQYDASAEIDVQRCDHKVLDSGGVCWSSIRNPTTAHLEEAKGHRKMAADHRAASLALRDAEAKMCAGVPDADRDMSPFEHKEDITSVEPLSDWRYGRLLGATITFRAVPGMTAQWLQRVVDCHLARNAALGHQVPEMPACPLVPKGVTAKVTATGSGFAVAVTSEEHEVAAEIRRRAQMLER